MFVIIICMALVVFMPLVAKAPLAWQMHKSNGYDNRNPRQQQAGLQGLGARALAAHQNCYEAIAYFAPTVLLVIAMDAHTVFTAQLCIAFVLLRLAYLICYWANWHIIRSILWVLGMLTIGIHYYLLLR
ncbi:MAPEG family protein [Glaciecola sp. 1036]|uniref:MAPEG family protein n=1 Tax=Alteromonadaceae TaxID=72275 RepID=UPI003CFEE746